MTRHAINRLKIKHFAEVNKHNLILFSTCHSKTKKDGRHVIDNIYFLQIQDKEKGIIKPELLFYYQEISPYLLSNVSIKLSIINGTQDTVKGIAPNL